MELQSSYIFIKQSDSDLKKDAEGNLRLDLNDSILARLRALFPNIRRKTDFSYHFRNEYYCSLELLGVPCEINLVISQVVKTTFLDISVSAKTTAQAIKSLEHIQALLLTPELDKTYIAIVSYDAISEYFCNKTFPMLNTLERNLRKLLFNTYIVQFGENYYQTTIKEEIQNKAKQRIGATGGKKVKTLKYIQEFFYSLEYGDVQAVLFTPQWTILEDHAKDKLLEANGNLSTLTGAELRDAISEIRPKSDWERFFSHKVSMDDPAASIKRLSTFRNSVAHAKFFNRNDYEKCRKLIKSLNLAILEAIRITEEQDFAEKNMEALSASVAGVLEKIQTFTKWVGEKAIQTAQALIPTFEKLGKIAMEIEREDRIKNMLQADSEDANCSHDMEMDNLSCNNDDLTDTE